MDKKILNKWNKKYLEGIFEAFKPTEAQINYLWYKLDIDGSGLTKYQCSDIIGRIKSVRDKYEVIDEVEDRYFEFY